MLNADIHRRLLKRFATELELWSADETCHLIVIGTFGAKASGIAYFEEIALMVVNENWIPYENNDELRLLNKLTRANQKYIKSLRYNVPSTTPLASAVLTAYKTTALYICPASASDAYKDTLQSLIEDSKMDSWLWDAGTEEIPALPA